MIPLQRLFDVEQVLAATQKKLEKRTVERDDYVEIYNELRDSSRRKIAEKVR